MKRKRLTRRESREITRSRLIAAAERLFVRCGFDATSVEQIAVEAGFSRGAFYSNFRDKDEIFLNVLDQRHREMRDALDGMFRAKPDAGGRFHMVRAWYAEQCQQQRWMVLETEFHLRALRSRAVRRRLSALIHRELDEYSELVSRYYTEAGIPLPEDPGIIAVSLYAMAQGLGTLSMLSPGLERRQDVASAGDLAFDRLVTPPGERGKGRSVSCLR